MSRFLPVVAPLLTLALLTLACNSNGGPTTTIGPTSRESPTVRPTRTPTTPTLSPTASPEKTPFVTQTPTPTATPTAEPITPSPTPIPAVAPADLAAFLAQYQGQTIDEDPCQFDPRTTLANCPNHGIYAIEPPLTGQDIECSLLTDQGKAIAIRCTSQEPLETLYYAIQ